MIYLQFSFIAFMIFDELAFLTPPSPPAFHFLRESLMLSDTIFFFNLLLLFCGIYFLVFEKLNSTCRFPSLDS